MLMRLVKSFLFASILLLSSGYHNVNAQNSCTTLRGQTGVCVPILSCKIIVQLLKVAPRPLPDKVTEVIRRSQSQCTKFDSIHVCCDPDNVDGGATEKQSTQAPSVVVSTSNAKIRRSSDSTDRQIQSGMGILNKIDCGKSDADRISNGIDANFSEYPWMALLIYSDGVDRTLDCGGSLITDRYVLTAAHCIRSRKKKLVSVRLGEHDTLQTIDCTGEGNSRRCAPPAQEIDIEESIYHKDFRPAPRFANDIALIRLVSPAIFGTSVKPVCLPITERSKAASLDWLMIAGWGKLKNNTAATTLQKAVVPLRKNNYCDEKLSLIKLSDDQLCAGGGDKKVDTCLGDSGGPIFYPVPYRIGIRYVQYGVVSAGTAECGLEYPSIFTKVDKYLDWIAGNLNY